MGLGVPSPLSQSILLLLFGKRKEFRPESCNALSFSGWRVMQCQHQGKARSLHFTLVSPLLYELKGHALEGRLAPESIQSIFQEPSCLELTLTLFAAPSTSPARLRVLHCTRVVGLFTFGQIGRLVEAAGGPQKAETSLPDRGPSRLYCRTSCFVYMLRSSYSRRRTGLSSVFILETTTTTLMKVAQECECMTD